jgi:predicted polyphosphate/ATP-dependent NAD kinase
MKVIGFLVNPIAGMGGRVGLKGTDGVVDRAIELGAEPIARAKAEEMLAHFRELVPDENINWLTCKGAMGEEPLKTAGYSNFQSVHEPEPHTSGEDTKAAVKAFVEKGAELIVFCGGDGTARDICDVTGTETPILGIPSGVKMYSGIFGVTPVKTAEILRDFIEDRLTMTEVEILDLDEDKYRAGEWSVRLYATARTPFESTLIQHAKVMIEEAAEDVIREEIAEYVVEEIKENPETLFLLGPGSTVEFVGKELNIDKTLLGIDAVAGGEQVSSDVNESVILELLSKYNECKLIVSPIGAQGFVLGRGNLQISPEVIRRIGRKNIIIISSPAKLKRTPVLRFDTGDADLDSELAGRGYISVVIGYRLSRLAEVAK